MSLGARLVALAVVARYLLDGAVGLGVPVLAQVGTIALLAVLVAARFHAVGLRPMRASPILWGIVLVLLLGAVRAPEPWVGLALTAKLLGPFLVVEAARVTLAGEEAQRRTLDLLLLGAGLVLLPGLLGLPERWTDPLHGYPRLLGVYGSPHSHAMAAALFTVMAGFRATTARTWTGALSAATLSGCAFFALSATYVRTGFVFVLVSAAAYLLFERRWAALAVGAGGAVMAWLSRPVLRERTADVLAVLTGVAPEQGWGGIGSFRFAIWERSLESFQSLPWGQQMAGLGAGGHRMVWAPRNPHNEYLLLLYDYGPIGPLMLLAVLGLALRVGLRRRPTTWSREVGHLLAALSLAAAASSLVSNALLFRVTLTWTVALLCGFALAGRPSEDS